MVADPGAAGDVVKGHPTEAVALNFDNGGVEDRGGGCVGGYGVTPSRA